VPVWNEWVPHDLGTAVEEVYLGVLLQKYRSFLQVFWQVLIVGVQEGDEAPLGTTHTERAGSTSSSMGDTEEAETWLLRSGSSQKKRGGISAAVVNE
jgi:hypothetical protein